jgi:hypothetical protein
MDNIHLTNPLCKARICCDVARSRDLLATLIPMQLSCLSFLEDTVLVMCKSTVESHGLNIT